MRDTKCGPSYFPQVVNNLLFGWFFSTSCERHDTNYKLGGSEEDRLRYDIEFTKAMLEDALSSKYTTLALMLIPLYYLAVRSLGWITFNYEHKDSL